MAASNGYRYPGARPFEDSSLDRQLFWGREQEADHLLHMLLSERLVVLYGRSGVGKSSLISAGVLHRLRAEGYGPIRVRLNDVQKGAITPVFEAVTQAARGEGWECGPGDTSSLWKFFKTLELWRGDELLTPLLVFDQFEELFTIHQDAGRQEFIRQFAGLIRGVGVSGEDAGGDGDLPAVKVLLSLREDCLPELEEMAVLVPHILQNRYRLEPLAPKNAVDAITRPAARTDPRLLTPAFTFTDSAVDEIVTFLANQESSSATRIQRQEVEPFQLQIICQRVEEIVRTRHGNGESDISIDRDLGGAAGLRRILSEFYEREILALHPTYPKSRIFRLCEQGLINPEGRRLTLEEGDIQRRFGLPREALLALQDRRVVRAEQRLGMTYYELSHDSLVAPVRDASRARRRTRRRVNTVIATVLVVTAGATASYAIHRQVSANALEQEAQALGPLARQDPTRALASAISVASRGLEVSGISTAMGEALIAAERDTRSVEIGRLPSSDGLTVLSPRGSAIFVASAEGTVRVFDARGQQIDVIASKQPAPIVAMAAGAITDRLAFVQQLPTGHVLQLWTADADETTTIAAPFPVAKLAFSADETTIALLGIKGELALLETRRGEIQADVRPSVEPSVSLDATAVLTFRDDGRWLVVSDPSVGPGVVRPWHVTDAGQLRPSEQRVRAVLPEPGWSETPDQSVFVEASGLLAFVTRRGSQSPIVIPPAEHNSSRGDTTDESPGVSSIAVSADGAVVVTGHDDGTVRTFDIPRQGQKAELRRTFRAASSAITKIAVNADGALIAVVADEANGGSNAFLWTSDGTRRGMFMLASPGESSENEVLFTSALFLPDASGTVLTGDTSGTIRFWRIALETSGRQSQAGDRGASSTSASTVATGPQEDERLRIKRDGVPTSDVLSMAMTRDHAAVEKSIAGESAPASSARFVVPHIVAASFVAGKPELLIGDQFGNWSTVAIDLNVPIRERPASRTAQYSLPRQRLIQRGAGAPALHGWKTGAQVTLVWRDGRVRSTGDAPLDLKLVDGDDSMLAVAVRPDDQAMVLLSARNRRVFRLSLPGARVVADGRIDPNLLMPSTLLTSYVRGRRLVDPQGLSIWSLGADAILAHDARNGHKLNVSTAGDECGGVTAATLGANGRMLLACSTGAVQTYDTSLDSRLEAETFRVDDTAVSIAAVAASRTGEWVAAGTYKGDVWLWHNNQPIPLRGSHKGPVFALAFSPDQRFLVTGGRSDTAQPLVKIWKLGATPVIEHQLRGHLSGEINYVEFSADGSRLLSAGDDGTVQVWDVTRAYQPSMPPLRHGSPVTTAVFASRGVISQTFTDGEVAQFYLWDAEGHRVLDSMPALPDAAHPWQQWLDRVCGRVGTASLGAAAVAACRDVVSSHERIDEVTAAVLLGDTHHLESAVTSKSDAARVDGEGRSVLHRAAEFGQRRAVAYLAGIGADLDAQDAYGRTPLMTAVTAGRLDTALYLLRRRASATIADRLGNTPLHVAALKGDADTTRALLRRGARVNAGNALGVTPLMNAASALSVSVVEELLLQKADVNAADRYGHTALMDAARAGNSPAALHIVTLLLSAGADVDAQTSGGRVQDRKTALMWARLASAGGSVSADETVVQALAAKMPLVTHPFPNISVRFPLTAYLPKSFKLDAQSLRAWTNGGTAGTASRPTFNALLALAESDAFAQFLVGRAYEVGIGIDRDDRKALQWYERSVKGGDPLGKVALAMLLWNGRPGIRQDMKRVEALLRELHEQRHPLGQAYYALYAEDIQGDKHAAREALRAAASSSPGDPVAQNSWAATLNSEGKFAEAAIWFKKAADQNDSFGISNYAMKAMDGHVPQLAPHEAIRWFTREAAKLPDPSNAKFHLGVRYEVGAGTGVEPSEALKWYRSAEQTGAPFAIRRIAWMLEAESPVRGVPDPDLVRRYYQASVNGDLVAASKLAALGMKP